MSDKAFLDSNIFLYAFTDKDNAKHKIAKTLILTDKPCISVQVVNEVSNNLLRKLQLDEAEVENFIKSCYVRYEIINLSKEIFLQAVQLRKKYYFSYYDSIIISSALIHSVKTLYSEDMQHNQLINDQLRIVNPFNQSFVI